MIVYIVKTFFRLKCFFASMSNAISMPCACFLPKEQFPRGKNQHNSVFLKKDKLLGGITQVNSFFFSMNTFLFFFYKKYVNFCDKYIIDSITILSDISLDAHCINVIVVSRVTVVLEVLFLSAQSMVLCLMHMT